MNNVKVRMGGSRGGGPRGHGPPQSANIIKGFWPHIDDCPTARQYVAPPNTKSSMLFSSRADPGGGPRGHGPPQSANIIKAFGPLIDN